MLHFVGVKTNEQQLLSLYQVWHGGLCASCSHLILRTVFLRLVLSRCLWPSREQLTQGSTAYTKRSQAEAWAQSLALASDGCASPPFRTTQGEVQRSLGYASGQARVYAIGWCGRQRKQCAESAPKQGSLLSGCLRVREMAHICCTCDSLASGMVGSRSPWDSPFLGPLTFFKRKIIEEEGESKK